MRETGSGLGGEYRTNGMALEAGAGLPAREDDRA